MNCALKHGLESRRASVPVTDSEAIQKRFRSDSEAIRKRFNEKEHFLQKRTQHPGKVCPTNPPDPSSRSVIIGRCLMTWNEAPMGALIG